MTRAARVESGTIDIGNLFGTSELETIYQEVTMPVSYYSVVRIVLHIHAAPIADVNSRVALYDDNAGSPNNLLLQSDVIVIPSGSVGEYTFRIPTTALSEAVLWVGFQRGTAGTVLQLTEASTGTTLWHEAVTYAAGFPDPAGAAAFAPFKLWAAIDYFPLCYESVFSIVNFESTEVETVQLLGNLVALTDRSWSTDTPTLQTAYTHVPYGAQARFSHFGVQTEQFGITGDETDIELIAEVNRLENLMEAARLSNNDVFDERFSFLRVYNENEDPKQSMIYQGTIRHETQAGITPLLNDGKYLGRMIVSRHPLWESVQDTDPIIEQNIDVLGGVYEFSGVPGTTLARVKQLRLFYAAALASPGYKEIWVGIREKYNGTTNFNAVWEAEAGTNVTGAVNITDAAAADGKVSSGASRKRLTFAGTTALVERMYVELSQVEAVAANRLDFRGKYIVLARMAVTGGTAQFGVQLYSGVTNSLFPYPEILPITNTSYFLYALGEIDIPIAGHWPAADTLSDPAHSRISLYVEHLSGVAATDILDIDCFVIIPARHLMYVADADLNSDGADDRDELRAFTYLNDVQQSFNFDSDIGTSTYLREQQHDATFRDFYLPGGDGMIVLAANQATQHVLSVNLGVGLTYIPRWLSYRGE